MEEEIIERLEKIEKKLAKIEGLIHEASRCDAQNFTILNSNNKMWIESVTASILDAINAK